MNGLLRDYFPQGTDLAVHTAEQLAAVATELNNRPRKTLNWATPAALIAPHLTTSTVPLRNRRAATMTGIRPVTMGPDQIDRATRGTTGTRTDLDHGHGRVPDLHPRGGVPDTRTRTRLVPRPLRALAGRTPRPSTPRTAVALTHRLPEPAPSRPNPAVERGRGGRTLPRRGAPRSRAGCSRNGSDVPGQPVRAACEHLGGEPAAWLLVPADRRGPRGHRCAQSNNTSPPSWTSRSRSADRAGDLRADTRRLGGRVQDPVAIDSAHGLPDNHSCDHRRYAIRRVSAHEARTGSSNATRRNPDLASTNAS